MLIPLDPIRLRYNGLYDLDGLYAAAHDWARNYEYRWNEVQHKHKVPNPDGAEQEYHWVMKKKVNDFTRYIIRIEVHTWEQRDVQVEGQPLTHGRVQIRFESTIEFDWQKKFKGSFWREKLGSWYYKLFMNKDLAPFHADELWYRTWDLHALFKRYFDLKSQGHVYKPYLGDM